MFLNEFETYKAKSSSGYLRDIFSQENREKLKGQTKIYLIEDGSDEESHNESTHFSSIYVKYKYDGSLTLVGLDPITQWEVFGDLLNAQKIRFSLSYGREASIFKFWL